MRATSSHYKIYCYTITFSCRYFYPHSLNYALNTNVLFKTKHKTKYLHKPILLTRSIFCKLYPIKLAQPQAILLSLLTKQCSVYSYTDTHRNNMSKYGGGFAIDQSLNQN